LHTTTIADCSDYKLEQLQTATTAHCTLQQLCNNILQAALRLVARIILFGRGNQQQGPKKKLLRH
jgi:hypothetical protein